MAEREINLLDDCLTYGWMIATSSCLFAPLRKLSSFLRTRFFPRQVEKDVMRKGMLPGRLCDLLLSLSSRVFLSFAAAVFRSERNERMLV